MLLSDRDIHVRYFAGTLGISPFEPFDHPVQPASLDVHLDRGLLVLSPGQRTVQIRHHADIDEISKFPLPFHEHDLADDYYALHMGEFALATTLEKVKMPHDVAAFISGRSTLARMGLQIMSAWIDPGFEGHVTLEMYNVSPVPILLKPDMRIAQLVFQETLTAPRYTYGSPALGSKYQGQEGVTEARSD